ncbi:MAG: ISKra4 family transposase, partial [bacterium]|nr:ISKra4 family transposase [bacterium]
MTHSELERELEEEGRELIRSLLQAHLDLRSPGEAQGAVRDAEDVERSPTAAVHKRDLATVFGSVEVRRVGYGAKGSPSLHPLDGELNLPPERYSHELRRRAAEEAAKGSFDEAVETLARHTGTKVPKRQLEEEAARAAKDFDAFYEQRSATAETASGSLMVLSF